MGGPESIGAMCRSSAGRGQRREAGCVSTGEYPQLGTHVCLRYGHRVRIFGMALWRIVILGVVGAATYIVSSTTGRPYLISRHNVFLPAAILLACVAGLNAVSVRKLLAEATRRTPRWELAAKQQLGPTLLQVFQACRQEKSGSPCCTIDEAKAGLRVYLLGRPLACGFARRLSLAAGFDFTNADHERWNTKEWVIGRAFTKGVQQGWRRSTDWPDLSGPTSQSDWETKTTDKMDVTYQQALTLHQYSAIIAIPIKRKRRSSSSIVGVLALLINDDCYPCIDARLLGTMALAAANIGQFKANGKP
jgi:hypothetical protein